MPSAAPTFSDLSNTTMTVTDYTYMVGVFTPTSVAALRAEATASTNRVAMLNDGGTLRIYIWNNTSTATDDSLSVIAPSDGGTGRWILQL